MKRAKNKLDFEYKKIALYGLTLAFFVFILFFAYQKTEHIWTGVDLVIHNPEQWQTVNSDFIEIDGSAPRAILLTINDNSVLVEKNGNFKHTVSIQNGYNVLKIEAEDKFGNRESELITLNGYY